MTHGRFQPDLSIAPARCRPHLAGAAVAAAGRPPAKVSTPEGETLHSAAAAAPRRRRSRSDWQACARILRSGDISFAEAYRDGQPTPTGRASCDWPCRTRPSLTAPLVRGASWRRCGTASSSCCGATASGARAATSMPLRHRQRFYRLWLDWDLDLLQRAFRRRQARAAMPPGLNEAQVPAHPGRAVAPSQAAGCWRSAAAGELRRAGARSRVTTGRA